MRLPVKLYPFSIVEAAGGNTLCPVSSQTTLYSCTVCFIIIGVSRSFSATEPPMQFVHLWQGGRVSGMFLSRAGQLENMCQSLSPCLCVFVYLCIPISMYSCICVFLYMDCF